MKSQIVKYKKIGKYFKVEFNHLNAIESFEFVKKKKDATIFQQDSHVLNMGIGEPFKIGAVRCNEFSLFLHCKGIKREDVVVEEFNAPEQPLLTKAQQKEIRKEFKWFIQHDKKYAM